MAAPNMPNQKDQRIAKLWTDRGMRDLAAIARKCGYGDSVLQAGIERVKEGLERMGIKRENG